MRMKRVRKSSERGLGDHGWLKSQHTFSFANYFDPSHMGFRSLRVINEDRITASAGFPTHGHRDMEIISYVIDGALEHKDSAGNSTVIRPGEVQRMSAGTGVAHSEYNHSKEKPAHFFQIWILPKEKGLPFSYGQRDFSSELERKSLVLTISPDGRDGSIAINQDAYLYVSRLKEGQALEYPLRSGRHAWVQVVKGNLLVNGESLETGDGIALSEEQAVSLKASRDSEVLLFDLD